MSAQTSEPGTADDEWGSSAIGDAFETLDDELASAQREASGAREIALSRSRDLLEKVERTLKKTA